MPTLNAKSGKVSWPWPGLDIRGDGGFAVLLGRNENGPYEQLRDLVPEPFDVLPEQVREFLRNHSEKKDALPTVPARTQQPAAAGEGRVNPERLIGGALVMAARGGRNNCGFWLACQLRDNGYSVSDAEAAMHVYRSRVQSTNAKGKREPYVETEMMASLRQAYSQPARDAWEGEPPKAGTIPAAPTSREQGRHGKDDPPSQKGRPPRDDFADDPDSLCIYVGRTGEPLVGYPSIPLSRNKYARVPREVFTDPRLEPRDVRVYCILASSCWQGSVAQVGKRKIAKEACCAECKALSSLRKLEATGHIQKHTGRRQGQRARYVLLSPVFGQKQRSDVDEVVTHPDGRRRLVALRKDQGTAWSTGPRPARNSNLLKR